MNRLLIVLVVGVLGCAVPGAAAAQSERGGVAGITQFFLLLFSNVTDSLLSKRMVADDGNGKIAADAAQAQDAGKSQEERRREAYIRVEEQEQEARNARVEYQRETRDALAGLQDAGDRHANETERDARKAREERLRLAEWRMTGREWEAQKAKEDYQRAARKAREERVLEAETARHGD